MTRIAALAIVTVAGLAVTACSGPRDPAELDSLTSGYWYGSVGPNEYVIEIRAVDGALAGAAHMIREGRQLVEIPISGGSLDGDAIEIAFGRIPEYRGRLDLASGRIVGGHPDAPAYRELNLTRVERTVWPMVPLRPEAPDGQPDYAWVRPKNADDGWRTGAPLDVRIDPEAVDRTVAAILAGEAGAMHSLLVARNGVLVVEEYFHGWDADSLHRIASCTKSVSSLLVGIAIDRGDLDGVDVPLLEFFPEHAAAAGQGWEAIRLEHLLTMSMGLDWTEREANSFPAPGSDRFADVLGRSLQFSPGTRWRYVSRDTNLLSAVILTATGSHADVFAAEHLFAPLGITSWDWENNKYEGHPSMSGTLKLRPRDMAKLGQLVLDEGVWNGRQVVSSDWIRESTRPHLAPLDMDEYGYLWWGGDEPRPGGVDFAMGLGGQTIFVAPSLDLVAVTTAGNDHIEERSPINRVLQQYLLPGINP